MRTSVFLKAWELVKSLGMNLREALVLAWKEIKAETIWNTINDLELKLNTAELQKELKSLYSKVSVLELEIKSLRPCSIVNIAFDNSGAAAWYDGKTFNND